MIRSAHLLRRRRPWAGRALLLACANSALSLALAHATVVFGALGVEPNPPPANAPFVLELTLADPGGTPVEDAIVRAELTPLAPDDAPASDAAADGVPDADAPEGVVPALEIRFSEVAPGRYRAEAAVPAAGPYRVLLRDRTFPDEEATQIVSLPIGTGEPVDRIEFLLPPTDSGGGLATWLLWLVAVPLIAGIVITVLVLRTGPEGPEAGDTSPDASDTSPAANESADDRRG